MNESTATIDGHVVHCTENQTILEAAHPLGIEIPTLCHMPRLSPHGGCRLCLVEVEGHARPVAACHTPLTPGMSVSTDTPKLRRLRRQTLAMNLTQDQLEHFKQQNNPPEITRLIQSVGLDHINTVKPIRPQPAVTDHPYLRFDPALCITCRRCLRACDEIQGQFVYGIEGRGGAARLIIGANDQYLDSGCTSCGVCVDACPTGAITDRDRATSEPSSQPTDSVCGYCGVGCRVRIHAHQNRITRIDAPPDAKVNHGYLCVKGRYAHRYHHHPDRLTDPLLRVGRQLKPIGWDEAYSWLSERLRSIQNAHGANALAAITSSRSTNEANYLLQKFFRTALKTNNVDCCARVCHASTALALQLVTGTGAASASYDDIDSASCIVVAGVNPTETHPVVGARIKQAALRGTPLIVIDPRRIELAAYADVFLQLRPGSNVAVFNSIANALIEFDLVDQDYLENRTEGLDALSQFLQDLPMDETARHTGLSLDIIQKAARLMGAARPVLFVHGLGLSELYQGTASVMGLCNLGMLTGSIGRNGAGMLPLRGQNNVQGNADMGGMPNLVTGYQRLDDPDVRQRLLQEWGVAPPKQPGMTIPEMIDAAASGQLRGLWLQGEDLAQSEPNQQHVITALKKLDLLVVQDLFPCESTQYAHLVLPAASVVEQDGTFTNGERRIQRVHPAVPPPGNARPDWLTVVQLARQMGLPWSYTSPADVMDEIARVAPSLFGGIAYHRLGDDGLQWPCPNFDHPGTRTVHQDAFLLGKGKLTLLDFAPSPETANEDFPFTLITGRILHQYNVGSMTRRSPSQQLAAADLLEINPADAHRLNLQDGQKVRVTNSHGQIQTRAQISTRVPPGVVFLSFHQPDTHTNRLVGSIKDPQSMCPDYKAVPVQIEAMIDGKESHTIHLLTYEDSIQNSSFKGGKPKPPEMSDHS